MHFPPYRVQKLVMHPIVGVMIFLLDVTTVASLTLWARGPHRRERVPLVAAMVFVGVLAVAFNLIGPVVGWWGGPIFQAPLLPLALLTGCRAMFIVGVLLLGYRWLARRSRILALAIYAALLLILVPATIFGDRTLLASGVITFENGYTIARDVLLGEVAFALPLIVYEATARALT